MQYQDRGPVEVPRFPFKYRANISNNQDPNKSGRIKFTCKFVLDDVESVWALPIGITRGIEQGQWFTPDIGAQIWVEFEDGDPSKPLWEPGYATTNSSGGFNLPSEAQTEDYPYVSVIKTKAGHVYLWNDAQGKEQLYIKSSTGHKVLLDDANKVVSVVSVGGHQAVLDDGNQNMNLTSTGGHKVLLDDLNKLVNLESAGGLQHLFQDQLERITHSANGVTTILDGNGGVLSHVPVTTLCLGDYIANLTASANSAINQTHLNTLGANINTQRLADMIFQATGMVAQAIPNAGAYLAYLQGLALSAIGSLPIPSGSANVFIKT